MVSSRRCTIQPSLAQITVIKPNENNPSKENRHPADIPWNVCLSGRSLPTRIFCKHGSVNTHQSDLTTLPGYPTDGITAGFLTRLNTLPTREESRLLMYSRPLDCYAVCIQRVRSASIYRTDLMENPRCYPMNHVDSFLKTWPSRRPHSRHQV